MPYAHRTPTALSHISMKTAMIFQEGLSMGQSRFLYGNQIYEALNQGAHKGSISIFSDFCG